MSIEQETIDFLTSPDTTDSERLDFFRKLHPKSTKYTVTIDLIKALSAEHLVGEKGVATLLSTNRMLQNLLMVNNQDETIESLAKAIIKLKSDVISTEEKIDVCKNNNRLFRVISNTSFVTDNTVIDWLESDKNHPLNTSYLEFLYLPKHCYTENLAFKFADIHPSKIYKVGCFDEVITDATFDHTVDKLMTQQLEESTSQSKKELFELVSRTYHPFDPDHLITLVQAGLTMKYNNLFSERTHLEHMIGRSENKGLYEGRLSPEQIDTFSVFMRETDLGARFEGQIDDSGKFDKLTKMPQFIEDAIKSIKPWLAKKYLNELEQTTPTGQRLLDAVVTISDGLSEMKQFLDTKKELTLIDGFTSKVDKVVAMSLKNSEQKSKAKETIYTPDFNNTL